MSINPESPKPRDGVFHIAPPNWAALCGQEPEPGLSAYDLCSLTSEDPAQLVKDGWCPRCVAELEIKP